MILVVTQVLTHPQPVHRFVYPSPAMLPMYRKCCPRSPSFHTSCWRSRATLHSARFLLLTSAVSSRSVRSLLIAPASSSFWPLPAVLLLMGCESLSLFCSLGSRIGILERLFPGSQSGWSHWLMSRGLCYPMISS